MLQMCGQMDGWMEETPLWAEDGGEEGESSRGLRAAWGLLSYTKHQHSILQGRGVVPVHPGWAGTHGCRGALLPYL